MGGDSPCARASVLTMYRWGGLPLNMPAFAGHTASPLLIRRGSNSREARSDEETWFKA